MRRIILLSVWVALMAIPAIGLADLTQNDRLMQRPEWDGAVMQGPWIEGALSFQEWDSDLGEATVWTLGPTFVTSLPSNPDIELGGRVDLMYYDPDNFDSETGVSDIDIWGKYQFIKTPEYMLSAGLLLTLPTGSKEIVHPHASGEVNFEGFAAGRYRVDSQMALIAHVALRKNSDMDVEINSVEVEIEGEMQIAVGGGVIYEVTPDLNLQGELNAATEAYDEYDNDIQLRFGADYQVTPDLMLRGGTAIGLDEGAPEWELTFRCAYLF